jgi:3-methyladenine DNA glycosylase AlkD
MSQEQESMATPGSHRRNRGAQSKGPRECGPTLKICAHVMTEKDAGVKKPVGWALRQATKSDPKAPYDFLIS